MKKKSSAKKYASLLAGFLCLLLLAACAADTAETPDAETPDTSDTSSQPESSEAPEAPDEPEIEPDSYSSDGIYGKYDLGMVSIGDLKLFPCDVGSVDGSYLILKEGDSMTYFNGTKSAETTYTLTNENVFSMDAAGVTMWGAYLNGGIVLTVPLQIFGGDDDAPDMMFYYAKEGSDASLALVAQLLKAGPMKDQLAAMDSVELAQLEEYYAWLFGDSSTATTQSKTSSAPAESEDLTLEEKNAVKQAQNYLNVSAFSYSGLIDQLEYEGYSTEAATKAVDSLDVDWMEQAAKKAESYMSISAFSRSGLINQLEYEGFSAAEAEYGAAAVGY